MAIDNNEGNYQPVKSTRRAGFNQVAKQPAKKEQQTAAAVTAGAAAGELFIPTSHAEYVQRPIVPSPGTQTTPTRPIAPPEQRLAMKVVKIPLDNATSGAAELEYEINGNVLWIPYSTNATDLVFIKPNDDCDLIPATRGWFLAGIGFNKVRITIPTAVAGAVLYLAYAHDPHDEKVRVL